MLNEFKRGEILVNEKLNYGKNGIFQRLRYLSRFFPSFPQVDFSISTLQPHRKSTLAQINAQGQRKLP